MHEFERTSLKEMLIRGARELITAFIKGTEVVC